MNQEEGKFLQERALKFWQNGQDLLQKGVYDLAAFNFEQAVQLNLKFHLFLLLGDFPKTHFLKTLLAGLAEALGSKKSKLVKFTQNNIDVIANLENAYLTARYLPTEFTKKEMENYEFS